MFFVVRSNYSFNFSLGLIKYIVVVVIVIVRPSGIPLQEVRIWILP